MTFTEQFKSKGLDEKVTFVDEERQKRIRGTPDEYVLVPVVMPQQSTIMPEAGIIDFLLGWMIGAPGPFEDLKRKDKFARHAIPIPIPDEDVGDDLVFMLNTARTERLYNERGQTSEAPLAECGV